MQLFNEIIQDLIGEHVFNCSCVSVETKKTLITLYSDMVDSFVMGELGKFKITQQIFKEFLKNQLPEVFEKADALRFEREAQEDVAQIINKSIIQQKIPQFEQTHQAYSKCLYMNPFIFEMKEGFYFNKQGEPYIYLEIPDIKEHILHIIDDRNKFPKIKASWLFCDDITPELVHRFHMTTYSIALMIRDITHHLQVMHPEDIIAKLSSVFIPIPQGLSVYYQNEQGQLSLPSSLYATELKERGLDKIPSIGVYDQLVNDKNAFFDFIKQNKLASGIKLDLIGGSLFGDFGLLGHPSYLDQKLPYIHNILLPMFLNTYKRESIKPQMLQALESKYQECLAEIPPGLLENDKVVSVLISLLQEVQALVVSGVGAALYAITQYGGFNEITARIGLCSNTTLYESLSDTGVKTLCYLKGVSRD